MALQNQIHEYLADQKDKIINILKDLIRIPSVRGEAAPHAPFGTACDEVLRFTEELYRKNGFDTELDADGGYLLSHYGNGKSSLGLFAHADVVPAGSNWTLTDPFSPVEKDGFIIGRGALDNKSAIVISLYCAKLIKDLNIPFSKRLVMFTGANEETGMADIKKYLLKNEAPDFSIVTDTAFPLYRGDKGILQFTATSKNQLQNISDFHGGSAFNITLGEAEAKIGEEEFCEKGISRHGALPEGSVNAAFLLAKRLSGNPKLCDKDVTQMKFIAKVLENYYGEIYGISCNDATFGKLTVTNGIARMKSGRVSLSFDMRYGTSVNIDDAKQKIERFFENNGWTIDFVKDVPPFSVSENDPYVLACLDIFKRFSGDHNAKAQINAGGTYARFLPRAAEIGTTLSGGVPSFSLSSGHGGVHQPDEFISANGLLNAIEITALMLLECDKIEV